MDTTNLPKDWVLLPALDLELKQYLLLAYLQRIQERFRQRRLYPHLHELRERALELVRLREERVEMQELLPKELSGVDPGSARLQFNRAKELEIFEVIDEIIAFALPELERWNEEGLALRAYLLEHIDLAPVGVLPMNDREGFLLLRQGAEASAYTYSMPLYRESRSDLQYRSVVTRFVSTYTIDLGTTYEWIKGDLTRSYRAMPTPAMFVLESEIHLPRIETYMPLAKQLVYRRLTEHLALG
ncbi:MAG: hypothetical protein KDB88_02480 [Flavobacteriales bacterium]|nr:hypothetical protein [Flavobacteriales bacterium]